MSVGNGCSSVSVGNCWCGRRGLDSGGDASPDVLVPPLRAEHAHAADRFAREILAILTRFCGALAAADGQAVGPPAG